MHKNQKAKKEFYIHLKDWADDSLPGWLGRVGVPRPGTVRLSFTTVPGLVLVFVFQSQGVALIHFLWNLSRKTALGRKKSLSPVPSVRISRRTSREGMVEPVHSMEPV